MANGNKWSKAQREKYMATMRVKKALAAHGSSETMANSKRLIDKANPTELLADLVWHSLSVEQKTVIATHVLNAVRRAK